MVGWAQLPSHSPPSASLASFPPGGSFSAGAKHGQQLVAVESWVLVPSLQYSLLWFGGDKLHFLTVCNVFLLPSAEDHLGKCRLWVDITSVC